MADVLSSGVGIKLQVSVNYWGIFFCLVVFAGCVPVYRMEGRKIGVEKKIPIVYVLIGEGVEVKVEGDELLIQNTRCKKFNANDKNVWIEDRKIEKFELPVKIASSDGIIKFNGKRYKGDIIIHKIKNEFLVVNIVNVEDYLKGVVPCELRTPGFEALKAQAVACRSFALAKAHKGNNEKIYDLKATVEDQVYSGIDSETELTNRAVDETRGVVCTYNTKVINAMYHSTCGGKTHWGGEVYLSSQACHFCESSPHYKWEQEYSLSDISSRVGKRVQRLEIPERDRSGRVSSVKILCNGENHTIGGEEFRHRLGLKSRFFDIGLISGGIKIIGRGYGHGVGLCQYGAIGMAYKGYDYKSILKYYYKGVRVERIYY